MASPPPPYANITGISRSVMKDNAQESLVNYDGHARPGELVLNLETDPPALYVGNNLGQLTLVSTGSGGASNKIYNGTSSANIATADGNLIININSNSWTFGTDGTLTVPADSTIKSASGDLSLYATGNVNIESKGHTFVFDTDTVGRFIMPPSGVIASSDQGNGLNIFTGNIATEVGKNWQFGADGTLTLPGDIKNGTAGLSFPSGGVYLTTDLNDDNNALYFDPTSHDAQLYVGGNITLSTAVVPGTSELDWTFGTDGELYTPQGGRLGVAGKGWTGLDGGNGNPVSVTSYYANGFYAGCFSAYPDGNVNISTYTGSNNYYWNFDNTGVLSLPVVATGAQGIVATGNAYPTLLAYGSGGGLGIHGGPELDWMNADDPANTFTSSDTVRNTLYLNGTGLYVGLNENGNANQFTGNLTLSSTNGDLTVPGNIVTNGASGNITGANVITANVFSSAGNTTVGNLLTFANLAVSGGDPLSATDTTIAFKIPVTINGNVYYLSLTAAQ